MQPVLKHEMLCWIGVPEACDDAVVHILCEKQSVLPLQPSHIMGLNLYGSLGYHVSNNPSYYRRVKGWKAAIMAALLWGWQVGIKSQTLFLGQYGPCD